MESNPPPQLLLQSLFIHECKTPISNSIAYLDMLLQGDFWVLTNKQISVIKNLQQENSIFLQYLDHYSKLLLNSAISDLNHDSINTLCNRIIDDLKYLLDLYPHTIVRKFLCPDAIVLGGSFIYFAIHGLLQNAILYSPLYWTIDVSTEQTQSSIVFTIKNSGPPLSEDEISCIFTPWYRSQSAQEKYPKGSGIWLYLIRMILTYIHGTIHCNSVENGMIFQIIIPQNEIDNLTHY